MADQKEREQPREPMENRVEEKEALIEEVLKLEDELTHMDKETAKQKKEAKQIKQSNTWIYSKPFRKSAAWLRKATKKEREHLQKQRIADLEEAILEMNKELLQMKQSVEQLELDQLPLHEEQIARFIREKRDKGMLIDFLKDAVEHKKRLQANYAEALRYIARLYMQKDETARDWVYQKVFSALQNEEIPEFMVRAGIGEDARSLAAVASFTGSLNQRIRQMQFQNHPLPEWRLDDKKLAYQFVQDQGIRTPWVSEEVYRLENLPVKEGIVIKPVDGAGSRGVYIVHRTDYIVDLKRSKTLHRWDDLVEQMHKDLITNWVEEDAWMLEELIMEDPIEGIPARDVKFYTFYGEVGIILEITRFPEPSYCWWTASGKQVYVGKYGEESFKGKGVTAEELAMVQALSKTIPAPFVRIDFLRAEDGLVFGEFTPKPGNYDAFNKETDQRLGDYFLQAESQLTNDLLEGKEFKAFQHLNKKVEEPSP